MHDHRRNLNLVIATTDPLHPDYPGDEEARDIRVALRAAREHVDAINRLATVAFNRIGDDNGSYHGARLLDLSEQVANTLDTFNRTLEASPISADELVSAALAMPALDDRPPINERRHCRRCNVRIDEYPHDAEECVACQRALEVH